MSRRNYRVILRALARKRQCARSVINYGGRFDLKRGDVMTNIHLVGGEKGGVGKSLVARLLAQYLIDKELPFVGFDTDRSHGALMRFYAGFASPVVVDSYEALDAIVEAAVAQPERRILVDLAAQTQEPLAKWMEESGVIELAEEA